MGLAEVNQKLAARMERATDAVLDTQARIAQAAAGADAERIDLRTAAYILAIGRVAEVAIERGIWP